MVNCSILGCKSYNERKTAGVSFHLFPDTPELRNICTAATKRKNWVSKKTSTLSSSPLLLHSYTRSEAMTMGGGHHEPPYRVPHYKTFKIHGIRQLEDLETALDAKGLKDPWIRNEAWRYHPGFGTRASRARVFFTRGMPAGIVLGLVSAVASKFFETEDPHHSHDGGHH